MMNTEGEDTEVMNTEWGTEVMKWGGRHRSDEGGTPK